MYGGCFLRCAISSIICEHLWVLQLFFTCSVLPFICTCSVKLVQQAWLALACTQIGFFDFVVRPLTIAWVSCFPQCRYLQTFMAQCQHLLSYIHMPVWVFVNTACCQNSCMSCLAWLETFTNHNPYITCFVLSECSWINWSRTWDTGKICTGD